MKHIEFIEFDSGWRPPSYRGIKIRRIKKLRKSISKNGNEYTIYLGEVSDEDACYLALMDQNVKIKKLADD